MRRTKTQLENEIDIQSLPKSNMQFSKTAVHNPVPDSPIEQSEIKVELDELKFRSQIMKSGLD